MTPVARFTMTGLLALSLLTLTAPTTAGPGAHGPNGEHLDAPGANPSASSQVPRFEASTESFELVGRLQDGGLVLFINRFETNEPVLQASVELDTGSVKATARFQPELGNYAVDSKPFLDAVSKPGQHPLVIMVVAGTDADLLEATLTTLPINAAAAGNPEHAGWANRSTLLGALGIGIAALAGGVLLRRRRPAPPLPGATR